MLLFVVAVPLLRRFLFTAGVEAGNSRFRPLIVEVSRPCLRDRGDARDFPVVLSSWLPSTLGEDFTRADSGSRNDGGRKWFPLYHESKEDRSANAGNIPD